MVLNKALRRLRAMVFGDVLYALNRQANSIDQWNARQTALLKRLANPGDIHEINYRDQRYRFYLPDIEHDLIQQSIAFHGTFFEERELNHLRQSLTIRGAHVVDVGANIGNHSVYLTGVCGAEHCIAFEPQQQMAKILSENADLNGLSDRIVVHRVGLSDAAGVASLGDFHSHNVGGTPLVPAEAGDIILATLDSFEVPRVDLIKIDVEGMAARVIGGARATIDMHRPAVHVEAWPGERADVDAMLTGLGYRCTAARPDNFVYEWGRR